MMKCPVLYFQICQPSLRIEAIQVAVHTADIDEAVMHDR